MALTSGQPGQIQERVAPAGVSGRRIRGRLPPEEGPLEARRREDDEQPQRFDAQVRDRDRGTARQVHDGAAHELISARPGHESPSPAHDVDERLGLAVRVCRKRRAGSQLDFDETSPRHEVRLGGLQAPAPGALWGSPDTGSARPRVR